MGAEDEEGTEGNPCAEKREEMNWGALDCEDCCGGREGPATGLSSMSRLVFDGRA